jgi:hypothetical protein
MQPRIPAWQRTNTVREVSQGPPIHDVRLVTSVVSRLRLDFRYAPLADKLERHCVCRDGP